MGSQVQQIRPTRQIASSSATQTDAKHATAGLTSSERSRQASVGRSEPTAGLTTSTCVARHRPTVRPLLRLMLWAAGALASWPNACSSAWPSSSSSSSTASSPSRRSTGRNAPPSACGISSHAASTVRRDGLLVDVDAPGSGRWRSGGAAAGRSRVGRPHADRCAQPGDRHLDAHRRERAGAGRDGRSAFAGTFVVKGAAEGVVVATGAHTRLAGIAALTQAGQRPPSPLARELDRVVRTIAGVALGVGATFFVIALLVGTPASDGFLFAIGVTVALVPEGLLPTLTLSLAIGAQRMATRHALVRRLESVETLGSTTYICTDKTGTLTRNEMTVVEVWTPCGAATVSGEGYDARRSRSTVRPLAAWMPCAIWRASRFAAPTVGRMLRWTATGSATGRSDGGGARRSGTQARDRRRG